jgi:small conductance mechanosensitive channel
MNADEVYDKVVKWLVDHGPRIIFAIVIFLIGQWVIRMCKRWLHSRLDKRGMDASLRPFFHSLLVSALQVFLLLLIMQILGIQMTLLAAGIASLGVAAGLALSGTLQNFTGGILILILKPFRVGDIIVAQGQEGSVAEILIFYTIITTIDKKTVIIPNSKLSNEVIINMSRQGFRRLDAEIKIPYTFDTAHVQEVVLEQLNAMVHHEHAPAPEVNVSLVEPDGYKLMASVWVDPSDYNEVKIKLNQTLLDGLKKAGVKFVGMP